MVNVGCIGLAFQEISGRVEEDLERGTDGLYYATCRRGRPWSAYHLTRAKGDILLFCCSARGDEPGFVLLRVRAFLFHLLFESALEVVREIGKDRGERRPTELVSYIPIACGVSLVFMRFWSVGQCTGGRKASLGGMVGENRFTPIEEHPTEFKWFA